MVHADCIQTLTHAFWGYSRSKKSLRGDLVVDLSAGGWIDGKTSLVRNAATDDRLLCLVLSGHSDTYRGTFGDFFLRPEVKCNINEVHPR